MQAPKTPPKDRRGDQAAPSLITKVLVTRPFSPPTINPVAVQPQALCRGVSTRETRAGHHGLGEGIGRMKKTRYV
jgi:hypothetical protein